MQLDSHRRRLSSSTRRYFDVIFAPTAAVTPEPTKTPSSPDEMPCRFSPRSRAGCCKPASTFTAEDGTKMRTWHSLRRENLWNMRRQVKNIVLAMAFIEIMRVGPAAIVYGGKEGYPPRGEMDFGIAYNVGYFVGWLYFCLFSIVYVPLFSWWVPSTTSDPENPGTLEQVSNFLRRLNLAILPISVGVCLLQHVYYTVMTLIYVDAQPEDSPRQWPKNTQKNWMARIMLLVGILVSVICGKGAFEILAELDLAHVKCVEYMVIVLPIQVNIGILLGSAMQWRMEKRIERKKMAIKAQDEEVVVDEKQALLDM